MWTRVFLLWCCVAIASGCSNDDQAAQPNPMMTVRDFGTFMPRDQDRPPTTTDMPPEPVEDLPVMAEMGPGDLGGPEADMVADMAPEMEMPDMAPDIDYPDVGSFTCAYPATDPACPAAQFGPASFFSSFIFVEDDTCCRDFDGDGSLDNFIGTRLFGLLETAFMEDFNANVADAITSGELIYLLEYSNWTNDRWDPSFDINVLRGVDDMAPFLDNLTGTGQFRITPSSYDMNNMPRFTFANARVANGAFLATGGTLDLDFPGLSNDLDLKIVDVVIEADVQPGANLAGGGGAVLLDGKLSGALLRDDLFRSLNRIGEICGCTTNTLFVRSVDGSYTCGLSTAEFNLCASDPDATCRSIGSQAICGTILTNLSRQADVDVDGDGSKDAYSFGAQITAVPASIVGRF